MNKETNLNPKLFIPSGLNERFYADGLSFSEYINQSRQMIEQARLDITSDNRETVIAANSPYEFIPSTLDPSLSTMGKKYKRAILMVHGLSDSPFILMDMGKSFSDHGYFVRGILLPGHGTVPGDLLYVDHEDWEQCIQYGVDSLKQVADEVIVVAFSMGGTLCIQHALKKMDLAAIVLLAPALKFTTSKIPVYTSFYKFMQLFSSQFEWFPKNPQTDYAKYETFTVNASNETRHLMRKTRTVIRKKLCELPMFMIMSADDEVISPEAAFEFFQKNKHPKLKMLIYGNRLKHLEKYEDIEVRDSAVPSQNIINFSHLCLSVSPNNAHYGIHGGFKDFAHYPNQTPPPSKEIFLGSPIKHTLHKYTIQRLRYNPDFGGMMERILVFLNNI
jgi:esterase/lipase